jgi:hypothetical protein
VSQDFEGAFPGAWNVYDADGATNGEYTWARRTCRTYAGSYSGWPVGGGLNGTLLSCGNNYPNLAQSRMVYGPFNLTGVTAADLSFQLWLNSEAGGADALCRFASIDNSDFYGTCTSGNSAGWVAKVLDLSNVYTLGDLRGQAAVWVALVFETNGSINFPEGAYVDNIVLRKCASGTCSAALSAAEVLDGTTDAPAEMVLQH